MKVHIRQIPQGDTLHLEGEEDPAGLDLPALLARKERDGICGDLSITSDKVVRTAPYDLLVDVTPTDATTGEPATSRIREAMGLGDGTLTAMVGAWIGWRASVLAFFMAAFIGLAHGLAQLVRHRASELPYAPSLCLASAAVIIGWQPLWRGVGGQCSEPLELAVVIGVVVVLTAATLFVWQRFRR